MSARGRNAHHACLFSGVLCVSRREAFFAALCSLSFAIVHVILDYGRPIRTFVSRETVQAWPARTSWMMLCTTRTYVHLRIFFVLSPFSRTRPPSRLDEWKRTVVVLAVWSNLSARSTHWWHARGRSASPAPEPTLFQLIESDERGSVTDVELGCVCFSDQLIALHDVWLFRNQRVHRSTLYRSFYSQRAFAVLDSYQNP